MSVDQPLKVVLYWHMHQPEYRDLRSGEYQLPWTYLHTIKDYVDMVTHLEAIPQARVVINFVPILLQQIDEYKQQVKRFFADNTVIEDPLLAALVEPVLPTDLERRLTLTKSCLRSHEQHVIRRFPAYEALAKIGNSLNDAPNAIMDLDNQYLVDLLVWYHLAWMGETVRRSDFRIQQLIEKGKNYSLEDRYRVLEVIGGLLDTVLKRYRLLAERNQIELSVSPYAHPILPLLLDIKSAQEAMPEAVLPLCEEYSGGLERARWHVRKGIEVFEHFFGFAPRGCWPSEGSVSAGTLKLLAEAGFQWSASGAAVLRHSLQKTSAERFKALSGCLHKPYRLQDTDINCFFRDDDLSDLIGFTYSNWHADDAVSNLVHHLENIAVSCQSESDSLVSIILDGENPWEHYPKNGFNFLETLYRKLSRHPRIELTTYSRYLSENRSTIELSELVAGSWVYGTFSTWISDKDKNLAWDMLADAKRCFDRIVSSGCLDAEQLSKAEHQLAVCEGSDWFWWFGDYNAADTVSEFELLFRRNLTNLYLLLGEQPPAYLSTTFTHGTSSAPPMTGTMRPAQEPA